MLSVNRQSLVHAAPDAFREWINTKIDDWYAIGERASCVT